MSRRITAQRPRNREPVDPAHAHGKHTLGPPPTVAEPRRIMAFGRRHQPWIPTNGLVGRTRRSSRRG